MDRRGNSSLERPPGRLARSLSPSLVEAVAVGYGVGHSCDPLLVVVTGATASGKTALAVEMAERYRGEIVSCDSVAVYRELELGTAKPSPEERLRARHHMLDVVDPDQPYTAGDYSREARKVLHAIAQRDHLPIVAGGTGLYLRALLDGLFPGPQRSEPLRERLRLRARQQGSAYLAGILRRLDPASAARIHANDTPKLIRAIEVSIAARQPMSAVWTAGRDALRGFRILRLGLDPPRAALYARIDQRATAMYTRGLVEETEHLIARYGAECRPLTSLGYKQAGMLLRGELSQAQAVHSTQQGHRNYAKRQATWFRREPHVQWLHGFGDDPEILVKACACVATALHDEG